MDSSSTISRALSADTPEGVPLSAGSAASNNFLQPSAPVPDASCSRLGVLADVAADAGSSGTRSSNSGANPSLNPQQRQLDLDALSYQLNEMAMRVEESHRYATAAHHMHLQALDRAADTWNAYSAATTGVSASLIVFHEASILQHRYQREYIVLLEELAARQASVSNYPVTDK
jgi:2-phospho-L-lactate transferase/gluconeogenesis factor (CofD/UPF0052 family)